MFDDGVELQPMEVDGVKVPRMWRAGFPKWVCRMGMYTTAKEGQLARAIAYPEKVLPDSCLRKCQLTVLLHLAKVLVRGNYLAKASTQSSQCERKTKWHALIERVEKRNCHYIYAC